MNRLLLPKKMKPKSFKQEGIEDLAKLHEAYARAINTT